MLHTLCSHFTNTRIICPECIHFLTSHTRLVPRLKQVCMAAVSCFHLVLSFPNLCLFDKMQGSRVCLLSMALSHCFEVKSTFDNVLKCYAVSRACQTPVWCFAVLYSAVCCTKPKTCNTLCYLVLALLTCCPNHNALNIILLQIGLQGKIWAAWYSTWLLNECTPKGVVFSSYFFSFWPAGKKEMERQITLLEDQFPGAAKGVAEFSTPLAHQIIAGTVHSGLICFGMLLSARCLHC